jgi:putative oxidoreductase
MGPAMPLLRSAARLLTGSTYAVLGFDAFRSPGGRVVMAGPVLAGIRQAVPLPATDEAIVRSNGAVQAVGGAMIALGFFPRTAALAVAASLVPTTVAGHPFWTETEADSRKTQQIHFLKNMAMLGGLFLVFTDASHR